MVLHVIAYCIKPVSKQKGEITMIKGIVLYTEVFIGYFFDGETS